LGDLGDPAVFVAIAVSFVMVAGKGGETNAA